jgi:hypothetical protein
VHDILDDSVLERLIWMTLQDVSGGKPLFSSPLEEPYFYQRHFKRWVSEGLEELRNLKESEKSHVQSLQ